MWVRGRSIFVQGYTYICLRVKPATVAAKQYFEGFSSRMFILEYQLCATVTRRLCCKEEGITIFNVIVVISVSLRPIPICVQFIVCVITTIKCCQFADAVKTMANGKLLRVGAPLGLRGNSENFVADSNNL